MEYTIVGKKLIICDGTTEIRYRDICDVISINEIEEIHLPATIKVIHDNTFFDWPGIKRIKVSDGVQYIGSQAFWGLDDMEELTLSIAVPFIGKHAFCNCGKLRLTILGSARDIPSSWDPDFAANIKEISFQEMN